MKKLLMTFIALTSITSKAENKISFLNELVEYVSDLHKVKCIPNQNSVRCFGRTSVDGFTITEKLKDHQTEVSIKIFGNLPHAFNEDYVIEADHIKYKIKSIIERDLLTGKECAPFRDSFFILGERQSSFSKCMTDHGQEIKIKAVTTAQSFVDLELGWDDNGRYIKKVIVKY